MFKALGEVRTILRMAARISSREIFFFFVMYASLDAAARKGKKKLKDVVVRLKSHSVNPCHSLLEQTGQTGYACLQCNTWIASLSIRIKAGDAPAFAACASG